MKAFKEFISEMTLVNRSQGEYPVGTQIKLSKTPNKGLVDLLKANNLNTNSTIEIVDKFSKEIGSGPFGINLSFDGVRVRINATQTVLNSSFAKLGGGKADTHKLTRVKEAASLVVFKHYQETGSVIDYSDAERQISRYGAESSFFNDRYYQSAILQLDSYKKLRQLKGQYVFEFQQDQYSKLIYDTAKKVGGISSYDNWNPGDLWLFRTGYVNVMSNELSRIINLNELNFWIRKNFLLGNVVSISLKASDKKSSLEIINPTKYKNKKLDYDFSLNRILIANSLKSCFIETNSGYTFKANARAKENNPTLYLEGTFKQENFSMGAIDAMAWKNYTKGIVKNGTGFSYTDRDLEESMKTFRRFSGAIVINSTNEEVLLKPDYHNWDDTKKRRYISIASLLDFVMRDFNEVIRWSFFTAMKVADTNSMYAKIK